MNTEFRPRCTANDLSEQIRRHVEELASATDASRVSKEMLAYLNATSKFHEYSSHNILLILMARPDATHVAGYHAWQSFNRYVRRGECGIGILAPVLVTEQGEDGEKKTILRGFRPVFVFDISQTDGQPLPEPPDWKTAERNALLSERLMAFAHEHGITVTEAVLPGETQGLSKGGAIVLAPGAGTGTLIHEIAHELLHKGPDAPADRRIRELEAEAVAFVVGKHFGLQSTGSPNYLTMYGASSELLLEHLERIRQTSAQIIQAIDAHD